MSSAKWQRHSTFLICEVTPVQGGGLDDVGVFPLRRLPFKVAEGEVPSG